MLPQPRPVKFTYEDYLVFPPDRNRHELIDGEHAVTPAPSTRHQRISRKVVTALENFLSDRGVGEVFDAPCDVVLSDVDVVQPDVVFVSAARAEIVTEACIRGTPDLVVEILSPATRKTDELVKRKLYEQHGVSEYWIVDPELETVKIYRMGSQGYVRLAELTRDAGDTLTTPLLPTFSLPLARIFG